MLIKNIKGLKYPDEYLIKFFFKTGLNKRKGRVIEFGSGNGNNLSLFYQYGWDVTGVDFDQSTVTQGIENFRDMKEEFQLANRYNFYCDDMYSYLKDQDHGKYDAILFVNSLYYLDDRHIKKVLMLINDKNIYNLGSKIFFRIRKDNDYRFGKGISIGKKCFKLTTSITDEADCTMTFFAENEFKDLLLSKLELDQINSMNLANENIQNNELIVNSDLVVWADFR